MALRSREILTTAIVVGIIALTALNTTVFYFRADITRNKIYTFSAATKEEVQTLPQDVRISYWVSKRLRNISPVPGQIEDILRAYAATSRGKVSLRVLDPNDSKEDPKSLGVFPEQMNIVGQSAQTTASVYSGIVIQYLDRHTAIPFIASTSGIEYALTAKIMELLQPQKWNVAVLVGNSGRSLSADYTLVSSGIGRFYHVTNLKPGDPIASSTRVLVVLGGSDLTAADLSPINSYLMQGGHILFCVPGVKIDTRNDLRASLYGDLPIFDLIRNYGVRIDPELVLDSHDKDFRTLRQSGGQYVWQDYGPYPHWISVLPRSVSTVSPITQNFSSLDLLWPSPLTLRNLPGVTYIPLVKSSDSAWTQSKHFDTSPVDIPSFDKPADPSATGQYLLAVSMYGRFPDYYSSSESPATRIVVVGDDNFVSNLVHYSNSLSNLDFLQNVVDWLAGNEGLLAIKTKTQWDPRLDRIQDPTAKLRTYRFAQFVNVGLVPIIVILFALRRYAKRKTGGRKREERAS